MARDVIKEQFDLAEQLIEEYEDIKVRRRANRDILRNLDQTGMLDEEQSGYLNIQLYPPRRRGEDDE